MHSKAPTLRQFQEQFPTEDACLDHLFKVRFGEGFNCPGCGREGRYTRVKARRSYQCQWCAHQVYPTANTPFDRTRTSLRDWFVVMFQFCTSRNGIAAKEVERQLGVTYKTAWRMCHQIREYMGEVDGNDPVGGAGQIVEVDEAMIGGKASYGKGNYRKNKAVVLGMLDGDVVTAVVADNKRATLIPHITANVQPGSEIHTDYLHSYKVLGQMGYTHKRVNHSKGEYVGPGGVTTNTLEGFWGNLQRAINGTHIHVSAKHLPKYLGEFEYRWNMRHLPHLMLDRLMVSFVR